MPLGGGVLIDRGHLYDLIDQLRVVGFPALAEGAIESEEMEALARAEREARAQLARAEEEAARLRRELDHRIGEQGLTKIAEERGRDLLTEANEQARLVLKEAEEKAADQLARSATVAAQQLEEADTYSLQLLQRLEEQISLFLENVRSGMAQLEGKRMTSIRVERYTHEPMIAPEDDDEPLPDDDDAPPGGKAARFPWMTAD